ncbi:MAG: sulfatase-like hydrolase/transferase [bacterium]
MAVLVYWCYGVFYSLFFPVFGGYFSHYVPQFSVAHSVTLGGAIALLGWTVSLFVGRRWLRDVLLAVILSAHFSYWVFQSSILVKSGLLLTLLSAVGVSLVLLIAFLSAGWCVQTRQRTLILFVTIGIGLIIVKVVVISYVPTFFYANNLVTNRMAQPAVSARDILYPFSIPLEQSLSRYSAVGPSLQAKEPIIMVVLDAFRKDYFGKTIKGRSITPTLDSMAADNYSLDRYYVQGSWTKPSTASLFTGRHVHDHGVCLAPRDEAQRLPLEYRTLAERLKKEGYYNIGSAFNAHLNRKLQFDQGFQFWIAPDNHYLEDYHSQRTLLYQMIRQNPERLFVYLHMKGPHSPYYMAPANSSFWQRTPYYENGNINLGNWSLPHPTRFNRGKLDKWKQQPENKSGRLTANEIRLLKYFYAAELNFFDRQHLRRFRKALRGLGAYKDSFLAVTGDHGEDLFDLGFGASGETVRHFGHMTSLRELVINLPLVLKLPDEQSIPPEQTTERVRKGVYESLDLGATILNQAKASKTNWQGTGILSESNSDTDRHQAIAESCLLLMAADGETDPEKIDLSSYSRRQLRNKIQISDVAYVKGDFKVVFNPRESKKRLYNVVSDFREKNPLKNQSTRKSTMTEQYYAHVGADTYTIQGLPGRAVPLSEEQVENIKGLGYIK